MTFNLVFEFQMV